MRDLKKTLLALAESVETLRGQVLFGDELDEAKLPPLSEQHVCQAIDQLSQARHSLKIAAHHVPEAGTTLRVHDTCGSPEIAYTDYNPNRPDRQSDGERWNYCPACNCRFKYAGGIVRIDGCSPGAYERAIAWSKAHTARRAELDLREEREANAYWDAKRREGTTYDDGEDAFPGDELAEIEHD